MMIPPKESESVVRFMKWDDEQIKDALEIIQKYEAYQTSDSRARGLSKSSFGGTFIMSQDLFGKFTKLPKGLLQQKKDLVISGIPKYFFHNGYSSLMF